MIWVWAKWWSVCAPGARMTSDSPVSLSIPVPGTQWHALKQGSPTPRPRTSTGPQSFRYWAAQQEVSGGRASEALHAAPHYSHYHLNHPPRPPVRGKIVFHKTGPWCQKGWGPLLWKALGIDRPECCMLIAQCEMMNSLQDFVSFCLSAFYNFSKS